jgi:hypothetical protein
LLLKAVSGLHEADRLAAGVLVLETYAMLRVEEPD